MSSSGEQSETFDPRVNSALQEFMERKDRGEVVDQEQFLASHAEIADQLRSFLIDSEDLARRAAAEPVPSSEISTNQSLSETIAPASPGATPILPEVFGRYRLQRLLGRGAMGAVYLAEDTQLSRPVAIKVPTFTDSKEKELLERFYLEARSAATLRNPHICPVYDVGEINGQHYISMAYISGHSLAEVIRANGRQPERQVLLLIRKLALALQEAHHQGIVHRDLKPGNIMIDNRGEPVVMDFGLACQTREGATRITLSGVILGSPAYMPPEQLEGNAAKVTPAADQYALGVILYELLTGELPFRGSISAVVSQIITKPAPSPRLLRPELDPRVDELCLKLMSKTPEQRLPSMQAVADRVLAILKEPAKAESSPKSNMGPVKSQTFPVSSKPHATPGPHATSGTYTQGGSKSPVAESPAANGKPEKSTRESPSTTSGQHAADISRLCLVAGKLIRKHDYAQARSVLSSVPLNQRTEELIDLLQDAEEKDEESTLLLQDIDLAMRRNQPKELQALVKRYLQLKPGNKAVRTLADDLQQYGPERVIQERKKGRNYLDPAGPVWNPLHGVYFVVGLALFCVAVYMGTVAFQTPNGTVIIEVHDPRVTVNFANDEITAVSSGKKYRLRTTEKKTLQLEIDGVTIDSTTQEITVARNETKLISARLIDGKLDLQINSERKTFSVAGKENGKRGDSKAGQAAAENAAAQVGQWIDLLSDIDPDQASGSITRWERDGTKLIGKILPSAPVGWIPLNPTYEFTGDYDLELDFLLVDSNYMQVALPLNETFVTLAISNMGTGLQWIDGNDVNWGANQTPRGNPSYRLPHGVLQHLTVSVRHAGDDVTVETKIDGFVTGKFNGLRSRLSTPQVGKATPNRFRLVAEFRERSDNHRIEIHKSRVRRVGSGSDPSGSNDSWISLFNGKDLTGWTSAEEFWRVTNGVLEIKADRIDRNSYLWTSDSYDDFELKFQYRLLNDGYLGLGFRYSLDNARTNVGPLVKLGFFPAKDNSKQLVVGELFTLLDQKPNDLVKITEAQRALLEPLVRKGEWIDVLVKCEGSRIIANINGIRTVDYIDQPARLARTGKIALYTPSYNKASAEVRELQVRRLGKSQTSASLAGSVGMSSASDPLKPSAGKSDAGESNTAKSSTMLLDVDFRKTDGGFKLEDAHHILSEHKNGEYRYMGKKPGWWYNSLHPEFWRVENNQLRDFAIEMDVRIVSRTKGLFAIEFGRIGDETISLCLNELGMVKLLKGNYGADLLPPTTTPAMRPVDQFNTLRLSVENKLMRVTVNGSPVLEKRFDRYSGAPLCLWSGPDEVPFDVRLQRIRIERLASDKPEPITQEIRRFKGHSDTVRAIAFLPDQKQAVSVGHSKAFKLWNIETAELIHDFEGHTDHVTSVAVSGDGRRALTGCWDGHVRLWDLENRTLLKTLTGHTTHVGSVLLSRDGLTGLSVSNDGAIRQWDLNAGKSKLLPSPAPDGILAMTLNQNVVASASGDGTIVLRSSQAIAPLLGHSPGFIEGLAFTPDATKLVSGADDGTVRVWDLKDGKTLQRFETDGVGFDTVAVANDNRYVIAGSGDHNILGWDIETGKKVLHIHAAVPVTHRMALSPDNQYVLSGGGDLAWKQIGDFDLYLWKLSLPTTP